MGAFLTFLVSGFIDKVIRHLRRNKYLNDVKTNEEISVNSILQTLREYMPFKREKSEVKSETSEDVVRGAGFKLINNYIYHLDIRKMEIEKVERVAKALYILEIGFKLNYDPKKLIEERVPTGIVVANQEKTSLNFYRLLKVLESPSEARRGTPSANLLTANM